MSLRRQSVYNRCLSKPQSSPQTEEETTKQASLRRKLFFLTLCCLLTVNGSLLAYSHSPLLFSLTDKLMSEGQEIKGLGVYSWEQLQEEISAFSSNEAVVASTLGNFVWKDCDQDGIQDQGEEGIPDVPITLNGTDDLGNTITLNTISDQFGAYQFSGLNAGDYTLTFGLPLSATGVDFTIMDQGLDSLDSDVDPLTGLTDLIRVENNKIVNNIDVGFIDTQAPTLLGIPAEETVDCNAIPDPPVIYTDITSTDNWNPNVTISLSESNTQGQNGSCSLYNYIIIRTWSADDGCGNSTAAVQIITVKDGDQPILNGLPADITIDPLQGEVIPPAADVTATDICDPAVVPALMEVDTPTGNCGFIRTRTWTAEDACGNQAMASQIITVLPGGNNASASSNSPVCGGASLLLFADGGNTYNWSGPANFNSSDQNPVIPNASPLNAGTYMVEIDNGTCLDTLEVAVVVYPEMQILPTVVNAECNALGSISLATSGGNGPYTFDWADLPGNNDPFDRSDLAPGTYSVTVSDDASCTAVLNDILIGDNCACNATTGNLTADQPFFCLQGPVLISATTDGNAVVPNGYNILYVLTSGTDLVIQQTSTIPQFVVSNAGEYTIHTLIYDPQTLDLSSVVLGVTTGFEVNALLIQGGGTICAALEVDGAAIEVSQAMATVATSTAASCGFADGTASLLPANYAYAWDDGGMGASRNDLAAGTYAVVATDANACTSTISVSIADACACTSPEVSDIVSFGSSCGQANGIATINVVGDPADFIFEWLPNIGTANATNNNRSDLIAGIYQVKIINPVFADCSTTVDIAISNVDGPEVNNIQVTPATCLVANGSATLLPSFYTYQWTFDNTIASSRTNLTAGVYEVRVFDQSVPPCPNVILVEIPAENPLVLSAVVNSAPTCQQANGSVTIDIQGGSGNGYNFSWGPDATRTDLAAGIYTVEVIDFFNGCVQEITFTLADDVAGATIAVDPEFSTSCSGSNDALASFQVTYDAAFAFPADTLISNGISNFNPGDPLAPGTYCIQINDANACLAGEACFDVIEPDPILVDVTLIDKDCFQAGSIILQVSGGNGNYTFDWNDLSGAGQAQSRTDLQQGTYEVLIQDANNCSRTLSGLVIENDCNFNCTEPEILNTLVVETTCGAANGSITIEMVGNPNQFNYSWSPNIGSGNANVRTALPAGAYEVTITNAIDPTCFIIENIVVSNSDGPQVNILNTSPAFCNDSNGAAVLEPITLNYEWCNGSTGFNPNDLPAGICFVTVTDPASGCTNVLGVEIAELNLLQANPIINNPPDCNQANGVVDFQILGGSGNYDIQWSDGGMGAPRSDLAAGIYSITITDLGPSACVSSSSFVLTESTVGGATVTINTPSPVLVNCTGNADAMIDFTIAYDNNFALPADTIISDGSSVFQNGNLGVGDYCLLIRDAAGCLAAETCFEVIEPEAIAIIATINQKTCADDGSILISTSGGSGNYTYNWGDLPGNNNVRDRSDLDAGIYQLTVTDDNNCEAYAQNLIVIDECDPCPNPSTLSQILLVNAQDTSCFQLESCFDQNLTTFILESGAGSGQSTIGSWTLTADGCVIYTANDLPGTDTICVIAQFGTLLDTTCFIYTVFDIPITPPITDTIYLSTLEVTAVDSCLDISELGGVFTASSIFAAPVNGTGTLTIVDNCVNYLPNPGVIGDFIDTMIVVICNDLIPVCDTSVIIVSVEAGPVCPDIFSSSDTLNLLAANCDTLVGFCLDNIVPFQMQFYTLLDNGNTVNAPFEGCNLDTIFDYDLDQILSVAPFGPYELEMWVVNADTFSLTSFMTFAELVDSMNIWDPVGMWTLNGNNIVGGFTGNMYSDLDVESQQASIMDPIPLDPLFIANGTEIPLDTGFHQLIITLDSTACSDTLYVQVDCNDCPMLYAGPDTLMADSCQGTASLCLDIPVANLLDYTINDNGSPFTGILRSCVLDTSYQYVAFPIGSPGIYELLSWEVNGTIFNIPLFTTVDQLADSMMVWDPAGNWELFGFVIVGGAPGTVYGDLIISINGNPPVTVEPQIINDATALLLPPGTHELEITNTLTQCVDLFNIEVKCDTVITPPGIDTLLNVFVGTTDTICFDDFTVITFVENLCPDANDGNVFLNPIFGTNCIAYSGLLLGQDTFCLALCDGPVCDTSIIVINVLPVLDTVPVFVNVGGVDTFCLDTTIFQNPIDTIYNFCENSSGTFVDFELIDGTVCIEYTGLAVGSDTACLVICDTLGYCDTTIVVATAKQPFTETIDTTVLLGDFDTFCIDTFELMGSIDTFFNDCDRISGLFVEFYIEDDSLCVVYEGISVGTDTACLVACDEFGICDTTYLIVTTVEVIDSLPPIAVNDTTETSSAIAVEIDITLNDTINGNLLNIVVVDQPLRGVVTGMGFNLVYLPDPGFCDGIDSFTYAIQNEVGWDTATVVVNVACSDLTVYTGFSPNADNKNDLFIILGIERFPNNTVKVYNRWGNLVFERAGYINDLGWDGTWNGQELPDGTYYYIINDGEGRVLNGYLQLNR